jgi:hypothetical protein
VNDALRLHIHDQEREDWPEPDIMELRNRTPRPCSSEERAPGLAITGRRGAEEALNRGKNLMPSQGSPRCARAHSDFFAIR